MTIERRNQFVSNLQTALLSVGVLVGTSCFAFVWHINTVITHLTDKELEYDREINTLNGEYDLLNSQHNNHETRISILEQEQKK